MILRGQRQEDLRNNGGKIMLKGIRGYELAGMNGGQCVCGGGLGRLC